MFANLSGETFLYPIIGDAIRFVQSPQRLTTRFEELGHNGICVPMQLPDGTLETFVEGLKPVTNVRGLLIAMPHKNAMFHCCATSSQTAQLLGVVSVVRRNPNGSWHGDILDGHSFVSAMKKVGATLQGARVLQIGAGGAGSAIATALLYAGVQELLLHDIDQSRCDALARLLSGLGRGRVVPSSPDPMGCNAVVNTTPLGMSPDDPLPVPAHLLNSSMFIGDVIAGHGITPFLQAAQAAGCRTSGGSQMVEAGMDLMLGFLLG